MDSVYLAPTCLCRCGRIRTAQQVFPEISQVAHVDFEWLGQGEKVTSALAVFESIVDNTSTDNASHLSIICSVV